MRCSRFLAGPTGIAFRYSCGDLLAVGQILAGPTGIEPAISSVTGRRVNRYATGPSLFLYLR